MYIILEPHSRTNATDEYLIVDATAWQRFANGSATAYDVIRSHTSHIDARASRDELNSGLERM